MTNTKIGDEKGISEKESEKKKLENENKNEELKDEKEHVLIIPIKYDISQAILNKLKKEQKEFIYRINFGNDHVFKKMIGEGSFSTVCLGKNMNNDKDIALKLECTCIHHKLLWYEVQMYQIFLQKEITTRYQELDSKDKPNGIPDIYWFYQTDRLDDHSILGMQLLGPSLKVAFETNPTLFTVKYVLGLAVKMISVVEFIHSRSFLHRDIKPDNFCLGLDDPENLYMIDFGLCKQYRDPVSKQHVTFKSGLEFVGTVRFASANALLGVTQGRRDDMESLAYCFLYFLSGGKLPWIGYCNLLLNEYKKYEAVIDAKIEFNANFFCTDTHRIPVVFAEYFNLCRNLAFDEKPKYSLYKDMFLKALTGVDGAL